MIYVSSNNGSLLPFALQPTVGCGLSNKILLFPNCYHLSPSSLNLSSFFFCSTFVTISFYCVGMLAPRQTPNLEDQGIPFLSGSSPLTCLAWEALPVAYATASIALRIIWPRKPHHYVKVGIPSGGIRNGRYLLIMVDTLRANWGRRLRRHERWISYQHLNTQPAQARQECWHFRCICQSCILQRYGSDLHWRVLNNLTFRNYSVFRMRMDLK
jgi:hypothetical protein